VIVAAGAHQLLVEAPVEPRPVAEQR